MLKVKCDMCDSILKEPGALLFSPPILDESRKYHICTQCFPLVTKLLKKSSIIIKPLNHEQTK